jgi:hypothetical protein
MLPCQNAPGEPCKLILDRGMGMKTKVVAGPP